MHARERHPLSFVNISSGPDVIYVNNIIALIVPKNYPKLSGPYSMISGPFPNHVRYIGLLYRVLFKLFQDFFDLIFNFFRKAIEVFYSVMMDNDFTHQMESRSL